MTVKEMMSRPTKDSPLRFARGRRLFAARLTGVNTPLNIASLLRPVTAPITQLGQLQSLGGQAMDSILSSILGSVQSAGKG